MSDRKFSLRLTKVGSITRFTLICKLQQTEQLHIAFHTFTFGTMLDQSSTTDPGDKRPELL